MLSSYNLMAGRSHTRAWPAGVAQAYVHSQNAAVCLATLVEPVATVSGGIMPLAAPYEMGV